MAVDQAKRAAATTAPTVLDLFSGAGGIAHGFAQAGYRIIGGLDHFQSALNSFEANIPGSRGMMRDLRDPDLTDVQEFVGNTSIDVIVGGPSCQGFSTSGGLSRTSGRDEDDPRNQLFLNYLGMVEELRPSWIVFENVPGLLLYNQGRVAIDIVRAFREIGYNVAPMILLAADFGVPQLRRRLVFVGNRTGSDIAFPAATHGNANLWRNFSLPFAHLSRIGHGGDDKVLPHVSFAEACGDLPAVAEGFSVEGVPYPHRAQTDYQRAMRKGSKLVRQHTAADLSALDRLAATSLKPGQNWRDIPLDHLPDRFKKIRRYDATTILKRLQNDAPAYTITTKFNEGTTGAFIHPDQNRTLTLREAARLQSFPDNFVFDGSSAQIRQQIGNAVPPLLARALGEAILPLVTRDVYGKAVEAIRDVVIVENRLGDADILKLRAPRRIREDADFVYDDAA
ncbi:MAG: DNA cytosine methyltransferase [Brevundimonas sp.]|uniref:DNA cytosine methyltransferase n=1 Tax=Brevundimonas sp. TaxID=1871086 RepID=UPI00256C326B|nr:DNA cytosine methyltransferase [Brevundimonas sp.]MDK2748123.1 DNA cytosine methyltransferase [Brevundimonas sp.]